MELYRIPQFQIGFLPYLDSAVTAGADLDALAAAGFRAVFLADIHQNLLGARMAVGKAFVVLIHTGIILPIHGCAISYTRRVRGSCIARGRLLRHLWLYPAAFSILEECPKCS